MPACKTCQHLKTCQVVDESKLLSRYYCDSWVSAAENQLKARDQIEKAFGPWALRFETSKVQTVKSAMSKMRRRHKNG